MAVSAAPANLPSNEGGCWGPPAPCAPSLLRRGRLKDGHCHCTQYGRCYLRPHPSRSRQALTEGRGFDAASVNYGGCLWDAEDWLAEACPMVGSCAGSNNSPLGGR